uniref:Uncharacterized protein n=1 Tax=Odontella aurita TaxID=265563 RepID=A0A7S4IYZ4_9STRA
MKFKAPEEEPGTSRIQLILPQQPISLQFEWSGSNPYAGLTSKLRKKLYGDITKRTREFVCSNLSGEKVRDEMSYARLEERKESNKLRAAKRSFDSHHRMHDMERAGLSPARDEDVSRGDQVYVFTQFTDGRVIEFSPMTVGDQSIVASGDSHGELGDDEESMLCVEDRMTSWRKVWMEKYPKEFKAYGSLNCYPPGGLDLKPVPRRLVFKTIPAMTGYEESGSGTGSIFLLPRESDEKTDRISPCPVCGGLFTRKALSSHLRVMKDSAHVNYLRQGMHV